jgi:hypothetical protein
MFEEIDWGDVGLLLLAEAGTAVIALGFWGFNWFVFNAIGMYKGTYWDILNERVWNLPIVNWQFIVIIMVLEFIYGMWRIMNG